MLWSIYIFIIYNIYKNNYLSKSKHLIMNKWKAISMYLIWPWVWLLDLLVSLVNRIPFKEVRELTQKKFNQKMMRLKGVVKGATNKNKE